MALVDQDFTVDQGSTFILQFDLKKDDNTPLVTTTTDQYAALSSLTNFLLRMKIRKSKYGTATLVLGITGNYVLQSNVDSTTGNTVDGFYFDSENLGRVKFVMSSETTADMKSGKYFYDIEVVETKGTGTEVTKAFSGRLDVDAEVTN
jgi:hypothetical protein